MNGRGLTNEKKFRLRWEALFFEFGFVRLNKSVVSVRKSVFNLFEILSLSFHPFFLSLSVGSLLPPPTRPLLSIILPSIEGSSSRRIETSSASHCKHLSWGARELRIKCMRIYRMRIIYSHWPRLLVAIFSGRFRIIICIERAQFPCIFFIFK